MSYYKDVTAFYTHQSWNCKKAMFCTNPIIFASQSAHSGRSQLLSAHFNMRDLSFNLGGISTSLANNQLLIVAIQCYRWPWLHYMENGDKVFCYICTKAYNERKFSTSSIELTYITNGYTNWKDAINSCNQHERFKCHADSILKIVTVLRTMKDVGEGMSSQHAEEKSERHQMFMKILQNIAFLAHQDLLLREDGS